jgi:signal peptidase I
MAPTLLPGDQFFVNVLTYLARAPERCEVVLVRLARNGRGLLPPDVRPELETDLFVSRVIGLPGETIAVEGGVVTVNGVAVEQLPTTESYADLGGGRVPVFEQACGDRAIFVAIDPAVPADTAPIEVQPDRYLVVSDHRTAAYDGRSYGTIHRNDVIGPATRIYYSAPPDTLSVRWDRILRKVE